MPKLQDLPDLFAGYNPSQIYDPIPQINPSSQVGELLAAGDQSTIRSLAGTNFQSFANIMQGMMAKQALRTGGVPHWIVEPFKDVFTKIPMVGGDNLVDFAVKKGVEIVEEALSGSAVVVSEAVSDAVTVVPIVGAIVKLGIGLGMQLRKSIIAENAMTESPPPEFAALTYEFHEDKTNGNTLAGIASTGDWTSAFLPPAEDPQFSIIRVQSQWGAPPPGGRPNTPSVRWKVAAKDGHGLVPGIADQVGTYQSLDLGAPASIGARQPSGPKFATVLWKAAQRPSAQMFMIDSVKVERQWNGYFDALWKFAGSDFDTAALNLDLDEWNTMWLRARIRQSASYNALYDCEGQSKPGVGACGGAAGTKPVFKPKSVVDGFPREKLLKRLGELSGLYSDIVSYCCQIHRERALASMSTLICAYASDQSPLVKAYPTLAQTQRDMRKLLLDDPAVMQVELALVPDDDYRGDVMRAQFRRPDLSLKSGGNGKPPKPGIIPAIAGTLHLPPPPDDPPIGLPEGVGGTPTKGDGGTGWYLAAAGGLALGALGVGLAMRRRRR